MFNKSFSVLLTVIILLSLTAQATTPAYAPANPELNQYLNSVSIPKIPPGHILYGLKISIENLQEKLTFNKQDRLLLKQKHLESRLQETQFAAVFRPNNIDKALYEAKIKTIEIESLRSTIPALACSYSNCDTISHNQLVLNNLLNSSYMPQQSKAGLQNAINRSGMRKLVHENSVEQRPNNVLNNTNKVPVYIAANMTQGNFAASPSALKLMPFSAAMVLDPRDNKWYAIIIKSDEIVIDEIIVPHPEYYLYPTSGQLTELEDIAKKVNKQRTVSFSDTLRLSKIWYSIQKTPVQ